MQDHNFASILDTRYPIDPLVDADLLDKQCFAFCSEDLIRLTRIFFLCSSETLIFLFRRNFKLRCET